MQLCTFKVNGNDRVGVLVNENKIVDVNHGYTCYLLEKGEPVGKAQALADVMTPQNMIGLIEGGESSIKAVQDTIHFVESNVAQVEKYHEKIIHFLDRVVLKAPVSRPSKIFCIAINNRQKYEIAGLPEGEPHPYYFIKLPTCVIGPYDTIEIPDIGIVGSEAELAVIMGKGGKHISEDKAWEHIFGYTVHNDITAHEMRDSREWIISRRPEGDKRLTYAGRYKCIDTFAPMGPWVVTKDDVPDINDCKIEARLNGKVVQRGSTADMFFKLPYIIAYLSEVHTLEAGDIISWGTVVSPPGVNFQKIDLRGEGGVLETEVAHIGTIANPIKAV